MTNEQRDGLNDFKRKGYIYRSIDCADELIDIISQNPNEFPDIKYNQLMDLAELLITFKWSAIQLLGVDNNGNKS